jgi:hypothetical protein
VKGFTTRGYGETTIRRYNGCGDILSILLRHAGPPCIAAFLFFLKKKKREHPAGKQNGLRFFGGKWTSRGPCVGFVMTSMVAEVPAMALPVVDHAARPSQRPRRTWTLQRGPCVDHHKVTYVDVVKTPDVVLSWTLSWFEIEQ